MLNQTELSELRSKSKIKEYKKGSVLIRTNIRVKTAMIVVSGSVK
jgi:CRP-like cAMP-binding protein